MFIICIKINQIDKDELFFIIHNYNYNNLYQNRKYKWEILGPNVLPVHINIKPVITYNHHHNNLMALILIYNQKS